MGFQCFTNHHILFLFAFFTVFHTGDGVVHFFHSLFVCCSQFFVIVVVVAPLSVLHHFIHTSSKLSPTCLLSLETLGPPLESNMKLCERERCLAAQHEFGRPRQVSGVSGSTRRNDILTAFLESLGAGDSAAVTVEGWILPRRHLHFVLVCFPFPNAQPHSVYFASLWSMPVEAFLAHNAIYFDIQVLVSHCIEMKPS